jgi:hypothetical protein
MSTAFLGLAPVITDRPDDSLSPLVFSFTFDSEANPVVQQRIEACDLPDGKVPAGAGVVLRPETCTPYLPFFTMMLQLAVLAHTTSVFDPLNQKALAAFQRLENGLSWIILAHRVGQINPVGLEEISEQTIQVARVLALLNRDRELWTESKGETQPVSPLTMTTIFIAATDLADLADHIIYAHLTTHTDSIN